MRYQIGGCKWNFIYIVLVIIQLGVANQAPNKFLIKISELDTQLSDIARFYGANLKVIFEKNNQVGVSWYSIIDSLHGYWTYNYMRFDTVGNTLIDARKFAVKNIYWEKFSIMADPYIPFPHMQYLTDGYGSSIIAYNYADDQPGERWRFAWVNVDSQSKISHNDLDGASWNHSFDICLSKKCNFHIINCSEYREPTRPERVHFFNYAFHYQKKKPHLIPPRHFVETCDNNILCLTQYYDSAEVHYQCISPKGKFLFGARVKINQVTAVIWDNAGLPGCEELFQWNDTIYYVTTRPSSYYRGKNRWVLVKFDKKGRIIKQKTTFEKGLLSIDSIPIDSKRFIDISQNTIYYYGFDHEYNLYYWNSKSGNIDYNRADIFAPFYSVHYNHVKDSIDNPMTENNLYPDSMNWLHRWSKGGKLKHDMKLLIGCNKQEPAYLTGELIGIRCGIIHSILNDKVYLAKAYYSPNKCGWLPDITFYLNGPAEAVQEKKHLGYQGDDVVLGNRPKVDLVYVSAGKIFNPSPDNLYYNKWAGIYRFETPGTYRISCSYTFDSIASSIKISQEDTLFSDTLEIKVAPK